MYRKRWALSLLAPLLSPMNTWCTWSICLQSDFLVSHTLWSSTHPPDYTGPNLWGYSRASWSLAPGISVQVDPQSQYLATTPAWNIPMNILVRQRPTDSFSNMLWSFSVNRYRYHLVSGIGPLRANRAIRGRGCIKDPVSDSPGYRWGTIVFESCRYNHHPPLYCPKWTCTRKRRICFRSLHRICLFLQPRKRKCLRTSWSPLETKAILFSYSNF